MIPVLLSLFLTTVGASSFVVEAPVDAKYTPDWDSLDSRPLPYWYDEAKVGIFLHWGVYSVPSFGSEWFWWNWQGAKNADYSKYMTKHYKPGFAYQEFGRDFTAELWNPSEWADLFEASGARYVVLTSKHHDGFCLWPTRHSFGWNSKDVGPHRDLIGELRDAILKKKDIRFGLYHSLFEWFNPLYLADKGQNFSSQVFVDSKVIPEMREIIERYQPLVLWSDGEWEADEEYWKSKEFIAWLYNESPVREHVVTNDRWGRGVNCKHGDFYTCSDRYNPGTLQKHKWENAMTLDKHSWGHRTEMKLADILTIEELISELVSTVSCGGNLLVNVGPTSVGTINPIFEERLRQMGEWLKVNGEAIYESRPWVFQNDSVTKGVWYTAGAPNTVYAIVLQYPYDTNFVALKAPAGLIEGSLVELLGYSEPLEVIASKDGVIVKFPSKNLLDQQGLKVAWTLKFKVRPNSVS